MDNQEGPVDPSVSLEEIYGAAFIDIEPLPTAHKHHLVSWVKEMKENVTYLHIKFGNDNGRLNDIGKQILIAGLRKLYPSSEALWNVRELIEADEVVQLDAAQRTESLRDITFLEQRIHAVVSPYNPSKELKRKRVDQTESLAAVRATPIPPALVSSDASVAVESSSTSVVGDTSAAVGPVSQEDIGSIDRSAIDGVDREQMADPGGPSATERFHGDRSTEPDLKTTLPFELASIQYVKAIIILVFAWLGDDGGSPTNAGLKFYDDMRGQVPLLNLQFFDNMVQYLRSGWVMYGLFDNAAKAKLKKDLQYLRPRIEYLDRSWYDRTSKK